MIKSAFPHVCKIVGVCTQEKKSSHQHVNGNYLKVIRKDFMLPLDLCTIQVVSSNNQKSYVIKDFSFL